MSISTIYVASEMNDLADIISFGLFTKIRRRIAYHQSAGLQLDGDDDDTRCPQLYKKTKNAGALLTRKLSPNPPQRQSHDYNSNFGNIKSSTPRTSISFPASSNVYGTSANLNDNHLTKDTYYSNPSSPRYSFSNSQTNNKRSVSMDSKFSQQPMRRSHSLKMKNMVKKIGVLRRTRTLNNITEEKIKQNPKISLYIEPIGNERNMASFDIPRQYRPNSYPPADGNHLLLEPPVIRTTSRNSQSSNASTATDANTLNFKLVYDTNLMPGMPTERPLIRNGY